MTPKSINTFKKLKYVFLVFILIFGLALPQKIALAVNTFLIFLMITSWMIESYASGEIVLRGTTTNKIDSPKTFKAQMLIFIFLALFAFVGSIVFVARLLN